MRSFNIGTRLIDENSLPYIIAEIGVNHEGSLEKAKELINLAKEGGADAAKFQTYKAETLASKHSPSYWDLSKESTTSQYELFKKYDSFGEKEYIELYEHCEKVGIDFLSTPFDDASIEFLNPMMKLIKIASADLTNIPFLRKIAKCGKPIVLSTGASTLGEIDIAFRELRNAGAKQLSILHCVLNYPTPDECAHLSMITSLMKVYPELLIGYSDHTLPDPNMTVMIASYLKGARIIEKHFTHDKTLPGNDHYHAMDVEDLKNYTNIVKRIKLLEGNAFKAPLETEAISRENARRSIIVKGSVSKGETITESHLTYKRPGHGISPLHWDEVLGRKASKALEDDHILKWEDLE